MIMQNNTIIVLGAGGFVGKNIFTVISEDEKFNIIPTYRTFLGSKKNILLFDLLDKSTWQNLVKESPIVIIDATGYGVVKHQIDLQQIYDINYLYKRDLINFLFDKLPDVFWLQIGTAFEYSLETEKLDEQSPCFPTTHYGISKLLFTQYLQNIIKERFCVLRPFGMFGVGEDMSKFFPMLICAQKNKQIIDLSSGMQQRDYLFVQDLGKFIKRLLMENRLKELESQIINIGSGEPLSIKELSQSLMTQIPNFDSRLWNWGAIPQRTNESDVFFNASYKAIKLGLELTPRETAFKEIVNYYYFS